MSAKVSFQVTTYFKRPRGEAGLTRMTSRRLALSQALDWVLDELPDEAVEIDHNVTTNIATVVIDWSKVPDEIRAGTQ